LCIDIRETSLKIKIKTGLKPKRKYIYRGRETDLVGRGVKAAKIKDRDAASSKLEKKIGS